MKYAKSTKRFIVYFSCSDNLKSYTPTATSIPSPTTSPDEAQIKDVLQEQVPSKSGVGKFEIVELNIKEGFAKATIKPLDVETDNAFVILQKKDNNWEIIYGPGTDLSPESPVYKRLPPRIIRILIIRVNGIILK